MRLGYLTMNDLEQRLAYAIRNTRNQRSLGWHPRNDPYLVCGAMAILSQALGQPWVERNTIGGASDFLGKPGNPDDVRLQSRICSLAEMVYNLASVPGLETLLGKLQAAEKRESYEVAYSELEAASLLKRLRIPFSVRSPSGTRGVSYDFDVVVSGQSLPCDAKCKVEGTVLTENSIYNPIHRANDQFPDGSCYWLMMKLPLGWDKGTPPLPDLRTVSARAFRNHTRLLAVIYYWEQVALLADGFHWSATSDGHVRPEAADRFPKASEVFGRITRTSEYDWTYLLDLLALRTRVTPPLS